MNPNEIDAIDALSPVALDGLRRHQWERQRDNLGRSVFYQNLLADKDLPRRWQDIADLPFTTKAMLRESQERHSPSAIIWQRRKRLCGVSNAPPARPGGR